MAVPDIALTFHVGMGKTGTSAIQAALRDAPDPLREHGLGYLGMWWSLLDPRLQGPAGIEAAAHSCEPEQVALAQRLIAHLRAVAARDGVAHFVFSNEALYAHTDAYEPLYARLAEDLELRFVVYVREPRDWLRSAYAQWGIRHPPAEGAASSFAEWAEAHVGIYAGLRWWHRRHGDRLIVRRFDPAADVVADFLAAIGSDLRLPARRVYETPEPARLLVQAWGREAGDAPPRLEDAITRHFDQSTLPALFARWRETFDAIRDELGIDLLEAGTQGLEAPSIEHVRARLIELGHPGPDDPP